MVLAVFSVSPSWCMHGCGECERVSCVDIESLIPVERVSEWPTCVRVAVVYVIRQQSRCFRIGVCLVCARGCPNHLCVIIGCTVP